MRTFSTFSPLFLLLLAVSFGCDRANFATVTDSPLPVDTTVVEFEEGFAFRRPNGDVSFSEGMAKRGNGWFAISSGLIACNGPDGYNTTWDGSNGNLFFTLDFYEFQGDYFVTRCDITTAVNGQQMTLLSNVPVGSGCPNNLSALTISELTDDMVSGAFTGDFFQISGMLSDTLPCSGFTYVGQFTATFSLPYEVCE